MKYDIFVFGSNLAGRHGKGAAAWAKQRFGAIYGVAEGLQGQSYAIPTKGRNLKPLRLPVIKQHVERFIAFAWAHPELRFKLTPVGCGLAGYKHSEIGPMFKSAPENVLIPDEFQPYL